MTNEVRSGIRRAIAAVALFSCAVQFLVLVVPLYSLQIYDRVLSTQSGHTLFWLSVIAIAGVIALAVIDGVRSRILVRLSGWLERRLAPSLLAENFKGGTGRYGALATQGLEDLGALRRFLTGPGAVNLFDAPWTPLYLIVLYLMNPWLGVVASVGAALLIATGLLNEFSTRRALTDANSHAENSMAILRATLQGAQAVRALGMAPAVIGRWRAANESVLELQATASDRAGAIQAFARFARLGIQLAVVGIGALLAIDHQITPGVLIAAAIIVSRALAPAESLIGNWRSVIGARTAYHRIMQRLAAGDAPRKLELPAPSGRLDVENVALAVPSAERPILTSVSFSLAAGESLGIVGSSAAGKSSLARVLLGLAAPSSGVVRFDGADVANWDPDRLGAYIGYLPQDVRLFPGTVGENIARLGPVDDIKAIDAAMFAGAHEMILRLPQGYDTDVDPSSPVLSGGQRQLIALARAFYGRPSLVVLDEPNSNLDRDGEAALMAALARARDAGMTVIVIAHRLSVMAGMDKILVMRDGRVAMLGARTEVLARLTGAVVAPFKRPPLARPDAAIAEVTS